MTTYSFFCPCDDLPRTTSQQKGVRVAGGKPMYYTKKKVQNAKDLFTSLFTGFRPPCPFNGPLRVQMVMTFPWRKSEPKANRARGWVPMPVKPDWDNLPKVPFDVMSNLSFWCDDGQIFDGRVIKGWGETPGVRVSITEVGKNEKYSEFFENAWSHRQEECK